MMNQRDAANPARQGRFIQAGAQDGRWWPRIVSGGSAIPRVAIVVLLIVSLAVGARAQQRPVDLTAVSTEELMQAQVTSASSPAGP